MQSSLFVESRPRRPRIAAALLAVAGASLLACSESGPPIGPEEPLGNVLYAGISAATPTGSAMISADGLVAAYDMETLTDDGLLTDFSVFGHHGRIGETTLIDGMYGRARLFRSVADRVHIGEHAEFDLDGPLTIAVWARVDSLGLHQHVVACDDKWALWITPADQFRLGDTHGGGWSTAEGRAAEGAWASVVAVLRGTRGDSLTPETVALYVDGELTDAGAHLRTDEARASGSWGPVDLFPTDACYLGFESHQGNEAHQTMPFVGAIDELLVFSRAWSEPEVQAFSRR